MLKCSFELSKKLIFTVNFNYDFTAIIKNIETNHVLIKLSKGELIALKRAIEYCLLLNTKLKKEL